VPVVVADAAIAAAPRTAAAAVPGATATRPDVTIEPRWAVCDTVDPRGRLTATTVLAGPLPEPGADPPADDAALLTDPGGVAWLVADGRRHRVDLDAVAGMGIATAQPRTASAALIGSIPQGAPFAVPVIPGRGRPGPDGLGATVGEVLVTHTAGGPDRYVVTFADGVQEIPHVLADLLLDGRQARETTLAAIGRAGTVHRLPAEAWPRRRMRFPRPADLPVTCWVWRPESPDGTARTAIAVPLPAGAPPVPLAQADGAGPAIDAVAVGEGGAVRGAAPGRTTGAGPVWLVSATGVTYGVADAGTAATLGVREAHPAPERLLRLLPGGPTLDVTAAVGMVDLPTPGAGCAHRACTGAAAVPAPRPR
ncbi:MAG: type VII secretion protein EccB, partial [Pseudonocardia sp.]|nr:type VII secretion protein EccB [Pseudonocardia sp.]